MTTSQARTLERLKAEKQSLSYDAVRDEVRVSWSEEKRGARRFVLATVTPRGKVEIA